MKQQEIINMSSQEIQEQIASVSDQILKLKLRHQTSPLENPMLIRTLRRTVAKLNTELTKRTQVASTTL